MQNNAEMRTASKTVAAAAALTVGPFLLLTLHIRPHL